MKIFYIAALIGLGEMLLLSLLVWLAARGKGFFAFLVFALKAATYILAIKCFVFEYLSHYMQCITGFVVGLSVSAVLLLIFNGYIKRAEEC